MFCSFVGFAEALGGEPEMDNGSPRGLGKPCFQYSTGLIQITRPVVVTLHRSKINVGIVNQTLLELSPGEPSSIGNLRFQI